MPLTMEQLVVVIPARNEATSIRAIADACRLYARHVIVVDDASTDDTAAQLSGLPVQLLRSPVRLGKGGALAWGFREALAQGATAVLTLDGDGQHDPADIPAFVAAANRFPQHLIIGARLKQSQSAPRRRLFANRVADFWISWAAGQPVCDSQCGQRLYPAELLRTVSIEATPERGFVFESEILIEAARRRFSVVSVPIESRYPPHARASHFHPLRDIWCITRMVAYKLALRGFDVPGLLRSRRQKPVIAA